MLADSLNPSKKKGRTVKMPVENFVTSCYYNYIVSLFTKEQEQTDNKARMQATTDEWQIASMSSSRNRTK